MDGDIAICAKQIGHFDWKIAFVLAVASQRFGKRFARVAIIALDKLIFGMRKRCFDILIGWAAARKAGLQIILRVFQRSCGNHNFAFIFILRDGG